jgi:hypothetical protein
MCVTDSEQRSVAVDYMKHGKHLHLRIPKNEGILPDGPYMLFVTDKDGTPSVGKWVTVD